MKRMAFIVLVTFMSVASAATYPANKPCSGKKGGISHCEGKAFVCRDGTTSQSKKDCRTFLGIKR